MREIKFRAWDKQTKDWLELYYEGSTVEWYNRRCGKFRRLFSSHVEIMLWTGLYDKNGKKIYEGDIVLYDRNIHKDIDTAKFKVVWAKDRYVLQEIKYKYYINDVIWELVEVIGNIYENPELLEVVDC